MNHWLNDLLPMRLQLTYSIFIKVHDFNVKKFFECCNFLNILFFKIINSETSD